MEWAAAARLIAVEFAEVRVALIKIWKYRYGVLDFHKSATSFWSATPSNGDAA